MVVERDWDDNRYCVEDLSWSPPTVLHDAPDQLAARSANCVELVLWQHDSHQDVSSARVALPWMG